MKKESRPVTKTPAEDVRKLLGLHRTVTIAGETIVVRPYAWKDLFDVISAAWPIVDLLTSDKPGTIIEAVAENRTAINRLVEISTGVTAEQIDAMTISDGLRLATEVWTENQDFFIRELTPMIISALGSKTAKSSSSVAPTSNPKSEETATSLAAGSNSPTS